MQENNASITQMLNVDILNIGVGVGAAGPALAGPLFWARIRWSGF